MPFLPPDWQFDTLSFFIGFAFATLIFVLLIRNRARLAALRAGIGETFRRIRDRLASSTDKRYREDLIHFLETQHLAGSIIALDEIYQPQRFLPETRAPLPGDEEFEPDITYVVPASPDYPTLAALYEAPSHSTADLARSEPDLIIIGRPGGGRTTALVHLGLRAAQRNQDYFPQPLTPIFFHVGDLQLPLRGREDSAQPLYNIVAAQVSALTSSRVPGYLGAALRNSRALLLMDGWDDLPPERRDEVLQWLQALREKYPGNRLLATAPLRGYAPLWEMDMVPVILGGWTSEDFRQLVWRWVEAWPSVLAAERRRNIDDVDTGLVAGWLSSSAGGSLPFDITLRIWAALKGDVDGPRPVDWMSSYMRRLSIGNEVPLALENAALETLKQNTLGLTRSELVEFLNQAADSVQQSSGQDPADLIDDMSRAGGLLAKRADNQHSFSHPLTMGYLAARAITRTGATNLLMENHKREYWQVVLRPFATLGDATPIAAQRLKARPDWLHSDLFTCAQWLADAPSNARWRNEVMRRLAVLLMAPDAPNVIRERALSALVAARDENVSQLFMNGLEASNPPTRQYAAIGLGALRDLNATLALGELTADNDLYVRWSAILALALIGDHPSLEKLGTLLLEGDEYHRLAVGQALALHRSEGHAMLRDAIDDQQVIVRRAAVLGLQRIPPEPWIVETLEDAFMNDTQWIVRTTAETTLEKIKSPTPRTVERVLPPDQAGWLIAWAAKQGKGVPSGEGGTKVMLQAVQEGSDGVRIAAADYLSRCGILEALEPIRAATQTEAPDVREYAARAFARLVWASSESIAAN